MAEAAWDKFAHHQGALLNESKSRVILLVYFHLILSGMDLDPVVKEAAKVVRIGQKKVYEAKIVV